MGDPDPWARTVAWQVIRHADLAHNHAHEAPTAVRVDLAISAPRRLDAGGPPQARYSWREGGTWGRRGAGETENEMAGPDRTETSTTGGANAPDRPLWRRRDFLRRVVGAGIAATGVVGLVVTRHRGTEEAGSTGVTPEGTGRVPDPEGATPSARPPVSSPAAGASSPFDFRAGDDGPRLGLVQGEDRTSMVRRAVEALGGMGRFVKKGERVLVKPNVGFATPPRVGATTHPDVVREVVRRCLAAGAAEVLVTDYPTTDADHAFRVSGIGKAAEDAGARVVLPREGQFRRTTLAGSDLFRDWPMLVVPLDGVDRVIGVAPVKDHGLAGVTLGIKNWYGLLGGRRNLFHQRIHDCLVDLARLIRPTFTILDGTVSMVSNGPTGGSDADLRATRTMIAGTDPVAVDACGVSVLGRSVQDFPWLQRAERAGLGTCDWEGLNPVRDRVG